MEGALFHLSSGDHGSLANSYKKTRNPKRMNSQTLHNGNLYHSESLNPPFPLSSSLPRLNSSPYPLQYNQPPLLPLPIGSRQFRSLPVSNSYKNKGNKNQTNTKKAAKYVNNNRSLVPKMEVKVCGSVFPEAPPPSSLPMPKFPLKSRMSCRVEANGGCGDSSGATGNLCRLLNLR